ncbi:MAG: hypothetical protein JST73_07885 [Actinobacteria bacterium]|nr:hypothetical protein [Actinomycetota bacterium]
MSHRSVDVDRLIGLIEQKRDEHARPVVVGVSGYGGSGKSTLVRAIVERCPTMVRLRGDDFLDPSRSHQRSPDWDGVERERLVHDVLAPFRAQHAGTFRRYDWSRRVLGEPEPIPEAEVLIVDLIGLFHPDALASLDLTIWVDVPLEVAQERGMSRDRASGQDHEQSWQEVWRAVGVIRVHTITIQARDVALVGRFWRDLLRYEVCPNHSDSVLLCGDGPSLLIQPSREPAAAGRIHLDLRSDEAGVEVARALSLGARRVDVGQTGQEGWTVMGDPEGMCSVCSKEPASSRTCRLTTRAVVRRSTDEAKGRHERHRPAWPVWDTTTSRCANHWT